MQDNEILNQITELTAKINELPKGYISKKSINGKLYFYHQWSENGQKQSKYLKDDEIEVLSEQIALRKELQEQLRALRRTPKSFAEESGKEPKIRNEVGKLKWTLMHKRTAVAEIELDDATGFIQKINTVYAPEHLPIGVPVRKGVADRAALNEWWTDRSIPASRSGIREAL